MRPTATVVLAIAAGGIIAQNVLAQGFLTQGVLAQDAPPAPAAEGQPSTEGRSIPRAPIGHRQPTMKDLPPDMARRQQTGEPPGPPVERDLDRQLRICRGC
jgi:hypothetical protein